MSSRLTLTSLLLSTLTLASPIIGKDGRLEARDEWQPSDSTMTCLYLTNEPSWAGEGLNLCEVGGFCGNQLPDVLASNVSSAGPEAGITCFLYSSVDCTGDRSAPLVNPGIADLSTVDFDKKAQSWQCWKWCGWLGDLTSSAASSTSSSSNEDGVVISTTLTGEPLMRRGALAPRLVSITTTIDGDATQTATTAPGLPSLTTTTFPSTTSTSASSAASSTSSQQLIFTTSLSVIVVTHTYADGSTTIFSTPLFIPVPVTSEAQGTTVAQTLLPSDFDAPTPFITPGVSITTTVETAAASSPSATEQGVSITTTLGAAVTSASSTAENGVSITTTEGVEGSPSSSSTTEGVLITITLGASTISSPSTTEEGVSITTTLETATTTSSSTEEGISVSTTIMSTEISEGVTVPVSSMSTSTTEEGAPNTSHVVPTQTSTGVTVAISSASPSSSPSEGQPGAVTVVTLTGVDATVTVTATAQ